MRASQSNYCNGELRFWVRQSSGAFGRLGMGRRGKFSVKFSVKCSVKSICLREVGARRKDIDNIYKF